jgi:O-antigen/teichoic acid export membrane protein
VAARGISGARELGLYSVTIAWAEAFWYFPTALKFVQRPYLVRAAPKEASRHTALAFRLTTLVTVLLGLGVVLAAPILCGTFFGKEFRGSAIQLRLLVIGAFGIVALTVLGNALVERRRPSCRAPRSRWASSAPCSWTFLLIPPYAGIGAPVATAIAYSAAGAVMLFFFTRALGTKATDLATRAASCRGLPPRRGPRFRRRVPGWAAP